MAHLLHANPDPGVLYRGLPGLFQYRNEDGQLKHTNCGQAATLTLLTHLGHFQPDHESAAAAMRAIEKKFPPDILGGWLGSSRRCVTRICKAHGVHLHAVHGEKHFRQALDQGTPALLMLEVPGDKFLGFTVPAGHWMVAFGYDSDYLYLTNYRAVAMPWETFRKGWSGLVPRFIQMRLVALVPETV